MKMNDEKKKGSVLKTIFVFIAVVVCSILLISVVSTVCTQVIPHVSIAFFQETGIAIEPELTFNEFSVQDMTVFIMMWFLPSLAATILITLALWKIVCICIKQMADVLTNRLFSKKEHKTIKNNCEAKEGEISE